MSRDALDILGGLAAGAGDRYRQALDDEHAAACGSPDEMRKQLVASAIMLRLQAVQMDAAREAVELARAAGWRPSIPGK